MSATTPTLTFQDTTLRAVERDGQIWLTGPDIARALGYGRTDVISRLYRQHAQEFTPGMSENTESVLPGNLRSVTRVFSLRGAHLLAMFARTPVAAEFRRWVLDLLDKETNAQESADTPNAQKIPNPQNLREARFLLSFDDDGKPVTSPVADDVCFVVPGRESSLATLIGEYLPPEMLPVVLRMAAERIQTYYNVAQRRAPDDSPKLYADAADWICRLVAAQGRGAAVTLLAQFDADNLSRVPGDRLPDLMEACQRAVASAPAPDEVSEAGRVLRSARQDLKVVASAPARGWKDPDAAEALLKSMRFRGDEMYKHEVIGPDQVLAARRARKIGPRQWAKLKALMA